MKPMEHTPYEPCNCHICGKEPGNLLITETPHLSFGRKFIQQILDRKRLTDAECAAEYWAVSHAVEVNMKHEPHLKELVAQQVKEQHTWYRLATTPHAFES